MIEPRGYNPEAFSSSWWKISYMRLVDMRGRKSGGSQSTDRDCLA